jgi:hypothetical protein
MVTVTRTDVFPTSDTTIGPENRGKWMMGANWTLRIAPDAALLTQEDG